MGSIWFREQKAGVRFDIQALRCFAVLAVFVFHLFPNVNLLSGGFTGVDIFFVISGYLMTDHLVKNLEARKMAVSESDENIHMNWRSWFGSFYYKRIKRLLPAALLVLLVSSVLVVLVFPDFLTLTKRNLTNIFASLLFSENWLLASNAVDYFAQSNPATFVQHFWSLSLEEQFYLIWPMFLALFCYFGWKFGRSHVQARTILLIGVIIFSTASFCFCVFSTNQLAGWLYFFTPSRVWELGTGGIVALLPSLASRFDSRIPQLDCDGASPKDSEPRKTSGQIIGGGLFGKNRRCFSMGRITVMFSWCNFYRSNSISLPGMDNDFACLRCEPYYLWRWWKK
ncbi:MAG: acyltransferase [Bifidobacteriaceae bacterium]|jgi:peptidoglycan/LPS O-acetylase OafA/YrhL|nr:acyltransferase [Bifidobacteriaceae bacterium]